MNYEKEIEKVIDKNFNKVNREGVGFLTTEMNKCKTDIKDLVKNLTIPVVINRRELLIAFADWYKTTDFNCEGYCGSDCVDEYLKSN